MPRFEPVTYTFILNRLINRVVARSELTGVEAGGQLHTILSGVAHELDGLNFNMTSLQDIWSIDTATGRDLDERALDYPTDSASTLLRLEATQAAGNVVFSRSGTSGLVSIPVSTVVRVPDGGPAYTTTAAGSIPDASSSSGSIAIIANDAGTQGNADAGTVTQFQAIAGVETVTNPAAITGGQDEETDERFRDRLKTYIRSLARSTPDALLSAVLGITVSGQGTIKFAEIVEYTGDQLGEVDIFVDNGTGTIETFSTTTGEVVIASAVGGEQRAFVANKPIRPGTTPVVYVNAVPLVAGTDYTLTFPTGQIEFSESTYPSGLAAADIVTADYIYNTGLIAEAQKVVDGDLNDRANYPGYRAAGTLVAVKAPLVLQQTVIAKLILETAFIASTTIHDDASAAINRYINTLGIAEDVIFTELVHAVQEIEGVFDVAFITPPANVVIGSGELARVLDANIVLT